MWSGLLPPGVNESDVDTSSDDEGTWDGPGSESILKEKREQKDLKGILSSSSEIQEPESITEGNPFTAVADEGQEFQTYPSGVSLDMWKKFQSLQKKNSEMKIQVSQRDRRGKRKRSRKGKLKKKNEETTESSRQSIKESQLEELTQYFGINDRFKSLSSKDAPPKSGLEISIDRSLAEGDIAQAEELSDRLATRELGVKISKAVACRNFVKTKQDAEASQEARKKKKLAWGFEAKKRWETKSNMGYM
ncbi:protein FAM204A isoform X1 [Lacerta agilis]|uniref:protein FAM204A isoform X1 n=1 Tax=Lacerta agilis TaxID=80427 RepID=UPI00141A5BE6|nr:protein FAM204A isoform X1 [Lacerta agilis]XP_033005435.1 protein FAM204A isoform X1 [Lacerta agilis]XP_033005436.1 protein FAM204A isoform X1 [Lacerta agilis]